MAQVVLRPAAQADASLLLHWRNDAAARAMSPTPDPVAFTEHARWLADALSDPRRAVYIVQAPGTTVTVGRALPTSGIDVGYLRLSRVADAWVVSIVLDVAWRGRGIGTAALCALGARHPERTLHGLVRDGNVASVRAFRSAGFRRTQVPSEGFSLFERGPSVGWAKEVRG